MFSSPVYQRQRRTNFNVVPGRDGRRLSRYPSSPQGDTYVSEKAHRKTSAGKGPV
ncbi:hypothetical protein [Xenorhabdus stockiae]|uniref:hypothetical protein n=1 Tax=Xenorhabdus stockiae TaxID=351614 RepID=UPI001473DC4F|nr:hypothetical protein [Xenorhabdus stockiae]